MALGVGACGHCCAISPAYAGGRCLALLLAALPLPGDKRCAFPSTESAGFPRTVRTSEKPTLSASLQPRPAQAAVWGLGRVPEGLPGWSPFLGPF